MLGRAISKLVFETRDLEGRFKVPPADTEGAGVATLLVAGVESSLAEVKSAEAAADGAEEAESLTTVEVLLGLPRPLFAATGVEVSATGARFLPEADLVMRPLPATEAEAESGESEKGCQIPVVS